jgi:hypothetical protein
LALDCGELQATFAAAAAASWGPWFGVEIRKRVHSLRNCDDEAEKCFEDRKQASATTDL